MEQKILAFSGRKTSGKNTSANFLSAAELIKRSVIPEFRVDGSGNIILKNELDQDFVLNLSTHYPPWVVWLKANVWPHVKIYSFADELKRVAINLFGLSWEQCYGTDEQKNSHTPIKWFSMSHEVCRAFGKLKKEDKKEYMTGRQFLQAFGTNVCRKIHGDCWVRAATALIKEEAVPWAIVADCRFPNEVEAIKNAGGKVIRFTRNPLNDDHESETCLDKEKFDWTKFDAVIDNQNMSIGQQNEAVFTQLAEWGWVDPATVIQESK